MKSLRRVRLRLLGGAGVVAALSAIAIGGSAAPALGAECSEPSVSLAPTTQTLAIGATASLTATVTTSCGPVAGTFVQFGDFAGPNSGTVLSGTSGADGKVTVSHTSAKLGTDVWIAAIPNGEGTLFSNAATVVWTTASTAIVANPVLLQLSGLRIFLKPSATLLRLNPTAPLAGRVLGFYAGNTLICKATTNAAGYAECAGLVPLLQATLGLGYTARFDGELADPGVPGVYTFAPSSAQGPLIR
jgi:hypothetical protein